MTRTEFVQFIQATFNAMDMITPVEGATAVIKAFDDYQRSAAAAGAAARPAQWQPIATAPKVPDDVIALGAYDKYGSWLVAASSWCDDPSDGEPCWLAWDYNMPPTHWTRLPAAPAADGGAVADRPETVADEQIAARLEQIHQQLLHADPISVGDTVFLFDLVRLLRARVA